ncbi:MAG TPA: twin-arginine translocase subunit TatC, partial [Desulfobacteria bacterium]|nr:twin-arginine translocase subunit TatC [Desulfobacteria bacterium]
MKEEAMSIMDHLSALRRTIVLSIISVIPGAVVGWFIRQQILAVLIKPVVDMKKQLVYLGATEAFTTELLIAAFAGIVIAMPFIAYQFWRFVLPALHAHEKRYLITFVPFSLILFVVGIVFGYFTVFSYGIKFL